MSKWLSQLHPEKHVKPFKPVEGERTVEELLRDVNFALSRMALLAKDLVPELRKIIFDAKANTNSQQPFSPGSRNPERMAERRGIQDVKEIQGVISHLERILEVAHALAFRPAPSKVRISATILLASQRFKKLLAQKRARDAKNSMALQ